MPTGYVVLNKTKKGEPLEYQYPFAFSGPDKFFAQVLEEHQLPSLRKDRVHDIMKIKYKWVDGSKVIQ